MFDSTVEVKLRMAGTNQALLKPFVVGTKVRFRGTPMSLSAIPFFVTLAVGSDDIQVGNR